MTRLLYSVGLYLVLPLVIARLLVMALRDAGYRTRWWQRFGWIERRRDSAPLVWLHAVSVGEARLANALAERLHAEFASVRLLVTTTTPTGAAVVRDPDAHRFFPYDFPGAVRRFVRRARPALLIVIETEIWPNLFAHCRARGIPIVIANARVSARSLRGYRCAPGLFREALGAIALVAAQSERDAKRYVELGIAPSRVCNTGTLKFDLGFTAAGGEAIQRRPGPFGARRPVFIAASTHEGEEELVLAAFLRIRARFAGALLVLAPRHPERIRAVAELCGARGLRHGRHSEGECRSDIDVFLIDTIGDLPTFYAAADIAFVGGSLVPAGGHNLIEPAVLGVPIVTGPHTGNFDDVIAKLASADAVRVVADAQSLAAVVLELLETPAQREAMARAAQAVVHENRGALDRLMAALRPIARAAFSESASPAP